VISHLTPLVSENTEVEDSAHSVPRAALLPTDARADSAAFAVGSPDGFQPRKSSRAVSGSANAAGLEPSVTAAVRKASSAERAPPQVDAS